MANYTGNQNILSLSDGISFLENDVNWELTNPFTMPPRSPFVWLQNTNIDLMSFSNNDSEVEMSQLHAKLMGSLIDPTTTAISSSHQVEPSIVSTSCNQSSITTTTNKRKAQDLPQNNPSLNSNHRLPNKKSSSRGKGSSKSIEKVEGNSNEVVHVRARRGQATDSHSIAERVRRGKINERLRCLQDIVPGCYKTMGMAVMLDEIINYVQSLQNQVEFLSMKLTAASQYYDFNAEDEPEEKKNRR